MIKIVIALRQKLIRESLQMILAGQEDFSIAGLAQDEESALGACQSQNADVLICDSMTIATAVKEEVPSVKVLLLAESDFKEKYPAPVINTIEGYIFKEITIDTIIYAIRVIQGGLKISDERIGATGKPSYEFLQKDGINNAALSDVEIEILRMLGEGKSNEEIATLLFFSEGTIRNKITAILAKLNFKNRIQLTEYIKKFK